MEGEQQGRVHSLPWKKGGIHGLRDEDCSGKIDSWRYRDSVLVEEQQREVRDVEEMEVHVRWRR